jgi:hypothetical protein
MIRPRFGESNFYKVIENADGSLNSSVAFHSRIKEPLHKSGRIKLEIKIIEIKGQTASNSPADPCGPQRRD